MKYLSDRVQVTFAEVPDEISLCIPITGCPNRCEGCHSPELREDIGADFTWDNINALIYIHKGITCVCLLGGDQNPSIVNKIARHIKESGLKVCWYSGNDSLTNGLDLSNFDYIKIGHYDKEKGPLTSKTTNQIMFQVINCDSEFGSTFELKNITSKFWKNED